MASFTSSEHRLPMSTTRLKPLILRDYLLDDLSSCSSNGFKSFPRRLLDVEIKPSGLFHHNRRITCGLALSHAVQKASTALLSAVKLLTFPSSIKYPNGKRGNKKGLFSISLSRHFWKKPSRRELKNVDGEIRQEVVESEQEIKRWRSFADFLQERLHQPSDRISCISPTDSTLPGEATLSNAVGDSSSFGSEFFTNSEKTQSSNEVVEDLTETTNGVVVMMSRACVGSHISDGSSVSDNREETVNEEKEQFSPISILEFPFEDDAITSSHQKEFEEKKLQRKSRRFERLVQLEPVGLERRIDQYLERQDYDSHMVETKEDEFENPENRLLALVKSRLIEEPNHLLSSHKVDNLLLDFFKQDKNNEIRDDDKSVKIAEEWVMRRQEEEYIISWEVREKREIYVKEMKWGCINGDEREYVVEELGNCFVTFLIDELILDLSL